MNREDAIATIYGAYLTLARETTTPDDATAIMLECNRALTALGVTRDELLKVN